MQSTGVRFRFETLEPRVMMHGDPQNMLGHMRNMLFGEGTSIVVNGLGDWASTQATTLGPAASKSSTISLHERR